MQLSRKHLRKLIIEELSTALLKEEEAEAAVDEEAEEEAEVEVSAEEEAEVEVSAEEEVGLSKSADDQILAHIIDFETKAIKSASLVKDDELRPDPDGPPIELDTTAESRWYKGPLRNVLFEEEEKDLTTPSWVGSPDIDVAVFASDVARLIMNYDSLIDMEALIISKSKSYLQQQYDQPTADFFEDMMDTDHDMRSMDHPSLDQENEVPPPPAAIGGGFGVESGGA
jgi:hypothetical protein